MIYIENEGALFRSAGFMPESPDEVYRKGGGWVPYKGTVPKPPGWGEVISEQDAHAMIDRLEGRKAA